MKKNSIYFLLAVPFILINICRIFLLFWNSNISIPFTYGYLTPSLIIVYSIFLFISFCFNSYKKANYILIIISFFLFIINQIKIFYMQEPIYLSDINLLGGIGEAISITNGTLINFFTSNWLLLIIQTIIFTSFFLIVYKIDEPKHRREYTALIQFIIFIILSLPFKTNTNIMRKLFINFDDYATLTNDVQYCIYNGIAGNMYYNMLDSRIFMPDDYNENQVSDVVKYQSISHDNNNDFVDIIFIFSESFFDVEKINDNIKFSDNLLEDYHNLKKNNKTIQLISPSYGGLSSNVEWELLTGFNLAYYNDKYVPYLKLVNDSTYKKENILSILSNKKYKNYVFYSYSDSMYNAGKVYDNLGLIKKKGDDSTLKGYYVSDDYVINQIIDTMKQEKSNMFYFATTMQSHMPYEINKYNSYNVSINESNLKINDQEVLLSYAEGINDASISLKKLYDYIQTINKKTIIIFMGDHLPYLSNEKGENVIDKLNYFNTTDILTNIYRKYNTEALILSNFKIEFDDTNYLSPDLLMPYVLNTLNIELTPYYNYLINESKKILPGYNRYISVNNDGKLFYTKNITGGMLKEYRLRESLQYKLYFTK